MRVLLAASPSVVPGAVTFVVFAFVALLVGLVGNFVARRLSNPVSKYRLLYAAVLLPVAVLSFVLLSLLDTGAAVAARVSVADGALTAILGTLVEVFAAGLVWLVGYAPTVRGVGAVRGVDLSLRAAMRSMLRYVVGVSLIVTLAVAPLRFVQRPIGLPVLALAFATIVVAFLYGSPWLIPLVRTTERPSGERADRVDRLTRRAELAVRDVVLLDTDDEQTASTLVRGPPGYRRLFVTTTFLEAFEDSTAVALLSIEAARVRNHTLEMRMVAIVGGGIAVLAALGLDTLRWVAVGVGFVVVLVGFWAARRKLCLADDRAAERIGAADLAAALRAYAEVHDMEPTRRRVLNPLSATVPLGDRIDRLE